MNDTNDYYDQHSNAFAEETINLDMKNFYREFLPLVKANGRILDAGCGAGRDSKHFLDHGFSVVAMDASPKLVAIATKHIGQDVLIKTFQQIEWKNEFDGVWCCASLLHVSLDQLPAVFKKLAVALKSGGTMYVSFKYGMGERVFNGRGFTDLDELGLERITKDCDNLVIKKTWQSEDLRVDKKNQIWLNAILGKV